MSSKNIKILVAYHQPSLLIKNSIFVPIHVGRSIVHEPTKDGSIQNSDLIWMIDNMVGDDTGDNISQLNRYFCEMTAIYWAWKNPEFLSSPEYIGLTHYRRQFLFDHRASTRVEKPFFPLNALESLTEEKIVPAICDKKIYAPFPKNSSFMIKDSYEKYAPTAITANQEVFDFSVDYIMEKYPQYRDGLESFITTKQLCCYNMFIMHWSMFEEYCSFVFDVLFSVYNRFDYKSEMPVGSQREIGYMGERLTGMFIHHHKRNDSSAVKYLPVLVVNNATDGFTKITASSKNHRREAIAFTVPTDGLETFAVAIASLISTASPDYFYEIFCLTDSIPNLKITTAIRDLTVNHENIEIKFVDISHIVFSEILSRAGVLEHLPPSNLLPLIKYFSEVLFEDMARVLFLHHDVILEADPSLLLTSQEPHEALVAATPDFITYRTVMREENALEYMRNQTNIDPYKEDFPFFDPSVVVCHIDKFRQENIGNRLINYLHRIDFKQDNYDVVIFNGIFHGRIHLLAASWNACQWYAETMLPRRFMFKQILNANQFAEYTKAEALPNLIHYKGPKKPWLTSHNTHLSIYFWKHARNTPYYENLLLARNATANTFLPKGLNEILRLSSHRWEIYIKWRVSQLFSKICFGQRKLRFIERQARYGQLYCQIKDFLFLGKY